ncbi:MAG TPA: hypothetical protein VFM18_08405 [Methanosarcina sp.]|nr:hypothetical protein [Methanosarcina sp.]
MPNNLVEKVSREHNIPLQEVEQYWDQAKKQAESHDYVTQKWAYTTAVFEKLIEGHLQKQK